MDKLYLQIEDDWGEELEDKTWCQDRVNESDIVYVNETLLKAIRLAVSMKDLEAVEHLVREGK